MMMDIRKRLFIYFGVGAGILVAVLLLYYLVRAPSGKSILQQIVPNVGKTEQKQSKDSGSDFSLSPVSPSNVPALPEDVYLRQLARIVVERSMSYSNQNNGQHLADMSGIVTDRLYKWLLSQAPVINDTYSGVTTKVVVNNLDDKKDDTAVVKIGVQQTLESGGNSEIVYKNGRVELTKVDGVWKADGLFWEK